MTWTKEITIWCDELDCPRWRQEGAPSVAWLRKELEPEGWVFVGGRDLCPEHRPKGRPIPPSPPLPEGVTTISLSELRERGKERG